MKRSNELYIYDILESITKIQKYIRGQTKKDLFKDGQLQDAIARRFGIIGEATSNISEKIKEDYPKIPWHKLAGMRNVIVHEYFGVDYDLVWKIIKKDLPALKTKIQKIPQALSES